jgi:hypothetical protein
MTSSIPVSTNRISVAIPVSIDRCLESYRKTGPQPGESISELRVGHSPTRTDFGCRTRRVRCAADDLIERTGLWEVRSSPA